jgi:hypothetical protein
MRAAVFLLGAYAACALLFAACSRTALRVPREAAKDDGGAGGSGGQGGDGGGGGAGGSGGEGGAPIDAGIDAPSDREFPPIPEEVFAASGTTLYRLTVDSWVLAKVGTLDGCVGPVVDIAIDRTSRMFATTTNGIYRVDPGTAVCTLISQGIYPNSLCTVPAGTVDPSEEALVGFVDDDYVRIDRETGEITSIGNLGPFGFISSGDMAVLPGGRAFLSVKQGGCSDCLVEIDPTTGVMLNLVGPIGYSNVFGLASQKGEGIGFGAAGEVFHIDLTTGEGKPIAVSNEPFGLEYFGAASKPEDPD